MSPNVYTYPPTPAGQIAALLVGRGFGAMPGKNVLWPISLSGMSDDPDDAISTYDTAGTDDGRLMGDGTRIIHPGVMVKVRSRLYGDGYNKADAIAKALDKLHNVSVPAGNYGSKITSIKTGPVFDLGPEEGKVRRLFTVNLLLSFG